MSFRVLLTGGGSGGHAYPLVAVAQSLKRLARERGISLDLMIMGDDGFLQQAALESGIKFRHIMAGKLRRYFSFSNIIDLFKVPIGILQSLWHLYWYMPNAIFSKGGYDSVPPAIAGRIYLIPVYVHESDSYPGLANSYVGRFARAVFISFQTAAQYFQDRKTVFVGNPVREEMTAGDRMSGIQKFNLDPARKTLLVLGGSQGAKQINDLLMDSLVRIVSDADGGYQIIHQCGDSQFSVVQTELDRILVEGHDSYADSVKQRYRPYSFLNSSDLALAYAAADIIISRAGAGSIFEIASVGKPAIIIPLHPSAGDHQFLNAVEFSKSGAVVVEGDDATTNILLSQIKHLLEPERYEQVSRQIRSFARPDAADKIAEAIISG